MDPKNLASYDSYYQYHDPITFKLQARREATLVTQIMPQRELMRTEFFNDFLARDGLHWGVNVYSYAGQRNIGDLRIWRGRHRENFDTRILELLRLVEPAFTGALMRAVGAPAIAAGRTVQLDADRHLAGCTQRNRDLNSRDPGIAAGIGVLDIQHEIRHATGVGIGGDGHLGHRREYDRVEMVVREGLAIELL